MDDQRLLGRRWRWQQVARVPPAEPGRLPEQGAEAGTGGSTRPEARGGVAARVGCCPRQGSGRGEGCTPCREPRACGRGSEEGRGAVTTSRGAAPRRSICKCVGVHPVGRQFRGVGCSDCRHWHGGCPAELQPSRAGARWKGSPERAAVGRGGAGRAGRRGARKEHEEFVPTAGSRERLRATRLRRQLLPQRWEEGQVYSSGGTWLPHGFRLQDRPRLCARAGRCRGAFEVGKGARLAGRLGSRQGRSLERFGGCVGAYAEL
mmetsp:Transcript_1266/g.4110  ORF Transcript_1266/g.4110 Transcript_1266/m.4110 type:complete len:262 (+) Transcript_1266:700-1485(+)